MLFEQDLDESLGALGLTRTQAHLVWEVGHRGPVLQRDLAAALHVTPRAVTGLVDALAADGLVTREPHPTDRRAALVTFTRRGHALAAKLERDHQMLAESLFGKLSRAELDTFSTALVDVIARFRSHLAARDARR